MRRMLITLLVFLLFPRVALAEVDPRWAYYHGQLHRALAESDWYVAKQALAQLRGVDPGRYVSDQYDLTTAWIARQEHQWDLVYRAHRQVGDFTPDSILEMTESLVEMKRYREALAHSELSRRGFSGRNRWRLYTLRAKAHQALGEFNKAIDYYKKLTALRTPTDISVTAYQSLVQLYYHTGDRRAARSVAEYLQNKRPASDAALFSVKHQETRETREYLDKGDTLRRFANVCYKNRDYERSDHYYGLLEGRGGSESRARARYFKALSLMKQSKVDEALTAFESLMPRLKDTRFGGPAAFQYARALFMKARDQDAIEFAERYHRGNGPSKWRFECMRLLILATRRLHGADGLQLLEARLKTLGSPAWILRFYYQNAVMASITDGRYDDAQAYMDQYARYNLKTFERQESLLWQGVIQWELGNAERAIDSWIRVVNRDPNHYFGLVGRELLTQATQVRSPESGAWRRLEHGAEDLSLEEVKRLYYTAPDDRRKSLARAKLETWRPAKDWRDTVAPTGSRAARFAEIGRYDWAARSLAQGKMDRLSYHFLKASWSLNGRDLHGSLVHGEILAKAFPRWTPYELIPENVQQLIFPRGFSKIIEDKAASYRVDPNLLFAIIREESRFNTRAKSWASARGLMQFIPETARQIASEVHGFDDFELTMLYDPQTSITLGARYVDKLMAFFDGESIYTVAAYNAGENAVIRWRDISDSKDPMRFVWDVTYDETKFYCQKVLRAYHHYSRVYGNDRSNGIIPGPSLSRAPNAGSGAMSAFH